MRYFVHLATIALFFIVACNQSPPALTDSEKKVIESEVSEHINSVARAWNEHDVDKLMQYYTKDESLNIIGDDGTVFPGWESIYKISSKWHADSVNQKSSISVSKVISNAVSQDLAIVTFWIKLDQLDETGKKEELSLCMTDILQRKGENWFIIHEHQSRI